MQSRSLFGSDRIRTQRSDHMNSLSQPSLSHRALAEFESPFASCAPHRFTHSHTVYRELPTHYLL